MRNTKEIFRDNLRKILQERGITLAEAAESCGISLSFLNQMLSGKKAYSPETIDKLSEGLQRPRQDFFKTESDAIPTAPPQSPHSGDRASRILNLQSKLLSLSENDFEVVEMTVNNLSEMGQNETKLGKLREK